MNKLFVLVLLISGIASYAESRSSHKFSLDASRRHPDAGLNTLQLITKYGFPVERHSVETEDGYVLEIHRIRHGRTNKHLKIERPPVLLMHALMSSSADWVNFGEKSLAFLLADLGYDVWLANARGNMWSRQHTTLDPNTDNSFWKFSWHEIGVYDLPAMIDYILAENGAEQIFYIGLSQGGTVFWVMASERPEYNAKIRLMTGLAPTSFTKHIRNPFLHIISEFAHDLDKLAELMGIWEFLPHSKLNEILGEKVCIEETGLQDICANLLVLSMGWGSNQLNSSMMSVIITNAPSGSATRQYLHYAQGIKYGYFRHYDFGEASNLELYGTLTPPDYKLENVVAPVAIFHSLNDNMVTPEDIGTLISFLPNVVKMHLVEYEKFNHIDFYWGNDVVPLVYDHVLNLMGQY